MLSGREMESGKKKLAIAHLKTQIEKIFRTAFLGKMIILSAPSPSKLVIKLLKKLARTVLSQTILSKEEDSLRGKVGSTVNFGMTLFPFLFSHIYLGFLQ